MNARRAVFLAAAALALADVSGCGKDAGRGVFKLEEIPLTIEQVDYEPAIHFKQGDPYPHLDLDKVAKDRVVKKEHRAVVLENPFIRLILLPEMGRVYSLVNKTTGHEVFWRNDIVTVGSGSNPCGWWLWIGGAEYTLPGDEHGTTWAERWDYDILADDAGRKTVGLGVTERGTGLRENIEISIFPGRSYYQADIRIHNPTPDDVMFAHWVNPQWAPGGRNELTDNTEFIIPTRRILIPERFRRALGPSPQDWETSPLRFIKGWTTGWGDLMAENLEAGFFGAYSHDEEEGVVRIFDPAANPGMDMWTYGFRPRGPAAIPMGSGAANNGYAEMWGGTSRTFPDERHPIKPGETIGWTEWMYPFQKTGGLTYANAEAAVRLSRSGGKNELVLGICPTRRYSGAEFEFRTPDALIAAETIDIEPGRPFQKTFRNIFEDPPRTGSLRFVLRHRDAILLDIPVIAANPRSR
ncbi:MAG: DUF5107 domain-containing protein [Acidobacteriota bacterium]|nr:DUF5107 domain-containing protein [Acidobacteriota bacterium]